MNALDKLGPAPLTKITLDDLMAEAESMGRPSMMKHDDGSWSARITFNTVAGTSVEAKSNYTEHKTAADALGLAIERGHEIRRGFK
jgi:hypothetical protein